MTLYVFLYELIDSLGSAKISVVEWERRSGGVILGYDPSSSCAHCALWKNKSLVFELWIYFEFWILIFWILGFRHLFFWILDLGFLNFGFWVCGCFWVFLFGFWSCKETPLLTYEIQLSDNNSEDTHLIILMHGYGGNAKY